MRSQVWCTKSRLPILHIFLFKIIHSYFIGNLKMDRLSVGMHVEIMRSDGRVHGALVTQLKNETKSVSVEWFEKVFFG